MTPALRHLAEFDGWIFSNTGQSCQRGRNGTNRRLTDLHYHDRFEWLFPAYLKLCKRVVCKHQLVAIQSALNLGDIEIAAELCGRLAERILKIYEFSN